MSGTRYAIYWAPEAEHELWREGSRWLGRDAISGQEFGPPMDIDRERWQSIIESPQRYGFHATLKAPFRLRDAYRLESLIEALQIAVSAASPFIVHGMKTARLAGFIGLRPHSMPTELQALADRLIAELDYLRQPLDEHAVQKQRAKNLSPAELHNLERWAYPYVFEQYRFHCSLAAPVPEAEFAYWLDELRRRFAFVEQADIPVDSVCIFQQADSDTPFILSHRIYFDGRTVDYVQGKA